MRQGEQIKPHLHSTHSDSYLGGHIVVQAQKTQTHYINPVNQINEPAVHSSLTTVGKISLFRSCMAHYTDAHTSDKPRITIAFDLLWWRCSQLQIIKINFPSVIDLINKGECQYLQFLSFLRICASEYKGFPVFNTVT